MHNNNNNEHFLLIDLPHKTPPIKKTWSRPEKLLLPAALLLAILFDRFVMHPILSPFRDFFTLSRFVPDFSAFRVLPSVFWLSWLVVFYFVYWKKVKSDAVLWFVAACAVALSAWNFIFPTGNSEFRAISLLVIPSILIAHAQWAAHGFTLKNFSDKSMDIVLAWFEGWILKPFTGLGAFFGVSATLVSDENRPVAKRVGIGLAIVSCMMLVIVPLLMGADAVFRHYVIQFFARFSLPMLIVHGMIILCAFGLIFSVLWNVGHGQNLQLPARSVKQIDGIISGIVLSGIVFVYGLFCAIQFTYLFARAGLPEGLTFAAYARTGFAQTVVICAINLMIFGVFLWRSNHSKITTALLTALIGLTAVKLVSGAVRLHLYIDTFGMTWLRLISAWFLLYLAAVLIVCVVRLLFKKKIPILGISAFLLLIWYVALGYLNPDGFIEWFNDGFVPLYNR